MRNEMNVSFISQPFLSSAAKSQHQLHADSFHLFPVDCLTVCLSQSFYQHVSLFYCFIRLCVSYSLFHLLIALCLCTFLLDYILSHPHKHTNTYIHTLIKTQTRTQTNMNLHTDHIALCYLSVFVSCSRKSFFHLTR